MKNSLYILLFVFFSTSLLAQFEYKPIAKEGKYWLYLNYTRLSGNTYLKSTDGFMLTIEGDSVVNNIKYKKIYNYKMSGHHCSGGGPCWYFDYPYKKLDKSFYGLIRDDSTNMKVYLYKSPCKVGEELELLNFRLPKGDSLNSCLSSMFMSKNRIIVEGNELDWAYKKYRRSIRYHGEESYINGYASIICYDGVGSSTAGILEPYQNGYHSLLVDFCEGSLEDCNIISSNHLLSINTQVLWAYPNPASDQLIIDIALNDYSQKDTELVLFDFTGKAVQKHTLPETVNTDYMDVSSLPSGIYTLHLKIGGLTTAMEKVVVIR